MILEDVSNLTKESHKQVCVECDLQIHPDCPKTYKRAYRDIRKILERNNKIVCLKCSREAKFSGRNNPNCKYTTLNDNLFSNIDDEYKAYILGYIASDGSVTKNAVSLFSIDQDIIIKIRNYICPSIPIKHKTETSNNKKLYYIVINSNQISKDICKWLKIAPKKKCYDIQFPNIDDKLKLAFIRGFFDGHGYVSNIFGKDRFPKCGISSGSKKILEDIKEYVNIPGSITYNQCSNLQYSHNNALDFLGKLYNPSSISMNRKYNMYQDWSTWIPSIYSYQKYRFVYHKCHKDAIAPHKTNVSDSGYDITAIGIAKDLGKTKLYKTGIKISPDYGYYFILAARSSLSKTGYMLSNGIGIIDRSYVGEILIPLTKIDESKPDLILPAKIAQIIPQQIQHFDLIEVGNLDNTARNSGGFGSTDIKK